MHAIDVPHCKRWKSLIWELGDTKVVGNLPGKGKSFSYSGCYSAYTDVLVDGTSFISDQVQHDLRFPSEKSLARNALAFIVHVFQCVAAET
jgi:hypothetical protein